MKPEELNDNINPAVKTGYIYGNADQVDALEERGVRLCGLIATRNPVTGEFGEATGLFVDGSIEAIEPDEIDLLPWDEKIKLFDAMVRERARVMEILGGD